MLQRKPRFLPQGGRFTSYNRFTRLLSHILDIGRVAQYTLSDSKGNNKARNKGILPVIRLIVEVVYRKRITTINHITILRVLEKESPQMMTN